jgi:AraC-like DNA-binding protein
MRVAEEPGAARLTTSARASAGRSAYRAEPRPPALGETFPLASFRFSTRDLPPGERFPAWRDSYAPIVDLIEPDSGSIGFFGEQELWDLGGLVFSRVKADGLAFARGARHVRRQPADHWLISVMLEGRSSTASPFGTFEGRPGAVQVHPLGKPFQGSTTSGELLQLIVPRDFFRGMTHLLDGAEFSAREDAMAKLLAGYMTNLALCLPALDTADLPGVRTATRTMILACLAPSRHRLDEAGELIADVLFERARCFVQANLASPDLGVASLQRELRVSRSRLYRLFEPYGGVKRYIQRRRLLDTHAALADPNDRRRILDIAEERFFSDAAEFSRAFKREFGYSPSEVRGAGKRGLSSRPAPDAERVTPGARLGALLRGLQA